MTDPRTRQHNRAVRAYQRAHPGTTLDQARRAVAARAGQQPNLPAAIPGTPLPRPAERLAGYVKRVAAAANVQRHRAMELLGLQPGTSATERLNHLTDHDLPDHTVRALAAATGMTPDQARALTTPHTATSSRIPDTENHARAQQAVRDSYRNSRTNPEGWTPVSVRLLPDVRSALDTQTRLDRNNPLYPLHNPGTGHYLDAALRTGPRTHRGQLTAARDLLEHPAVGTVVHVIVGAEAHEILTALVTNAQPRTAHLLLSAITTQFLDQYNPQPPHQQHQLPEPPLHNGNSR